ncbi:hypothetical protein N7520_009530 [Penicillium odoratum]|uniref:uncharacterized protein n=1 Tax=Penicillium odoratum TaxID=1167516 RepID=UPI002549AB82|nr:uncharacterized protein N7520_009530 [Penicillium odoratum]KAJ5752613.1 hypothetical protein N7520_009530 [Penicillium odoratum]
MTVHRKRCALDSPSKQLMDDLARELQQAKIFDNDMRKVRAYERKTFYEKLDRLDREREEVHTAALDKVAAQHAQIGREAEEILREHNRAEEEERRRKEEQARKERERIEREKAERLRLEQEEAARLEAAREAAREAERKTKEEQKKKAEEEAERVRRAAQEQKEREERQQRDKVEAENRARKEEAKKAQEAAEEKARSQQQQKQQKFGGSSLAPEEINIQERYVALHKTLKEMRAWLRDFGKKEPVIKKAMGDMRRSITKSVGQLRDAKGVNKQQTQQIRAELEKALTISEPTVDVRQFFAFPPEEIANSENKVPALLIYGLNILAKCLIKALIVEAAAKPGHAEPVGILAAQIFSTETFMYKGLHMSDILWAKYRVVCPALWGFTGREDTESGRRAIGWWRNDDGTSFVSEQTHLDRMTALGAGFAALSLRNFGKTTRRNPFPNTIFWQSLQKILSLPPSDILDTQVTLLQSMLRPSGDRILGFFGQIGLVLVRQAVVGLPPALNRNTMPVNQLKLVKELYYRESNILL